MSVKLGLLTLLSRQAMHGYQLRQEFERATGSTWPLNIGQVYTTLNRLARDGMIADDGGDGEDPQRVYRITASGTAALDAWWGTPVEATAAPPRSELAIKLALAVTTPGVDVSAVIQTQRAATIKAMQDYTRARERAGEDLSWLLVIDSLVFAAEAEVRWLDHTEVRIARHLHDPLPAADAVDPAPPASAARRVRRSAR